MKFEGTIVVMTSIKTLVARLGVVLLLPCLQAVVIAQAAKPAQAKGEPATQSAPSSQPAPDTSTKQPEPDTSVPPPGTLEYVCPDLHLYPAKPAKGVKLGNSRPILTKDWQQDYPVLIYEATSQKRYWLEPPVKEPGKKKARSPYIALTEIDSVFTPATFTTEKVLIAVCGLKFGQTATTSQINITVPDAIVIEGAPAPGGPGGPGGVEKLGEDPQTLFDDLSVTPPKNEAGGSCTQFSKDYNKAVEDINTLKQKYHALLLFAASSGLLPVTGDLFSSKKMMTGIKDEGLKIECAAAQDASRTDAASYQRNSLIVQRRSERLTAVVQAYNSAVTTIQAFANAGDSLVKDQNNLSNDETKVHSETCGITNLGDLQGTLKEGKKRADSVISSIESVQGELQTAETGIIHNFTQLNEWSQKSSVSALGILGPVAANTLLQLSFTVSDPPPPASYKVVQVSDLKNSDPDKPKPATTITIDKSVANKIVISVTGTSSPAAVTVTTDSNGNPSATVQVPGTSSAPTGNAQPAGTPAPQPPTNNLNVTAAPSGKSAANAPPGGNAPAPTALTANSNLQERHRWANFAVSGGFLGIRFTNTTYSALTLPVTAVTTTVTTTSVPTTPPTVNIGTPVVSSATYAFATVNGPIQSTATAGITWYLFGHDTYPTTKLGKLGPLLSSYSYRRTQERFGFFIGTSVSSLGNFTLGPSFDIVPGLQLYSGVVLENRSTLGAGFIPCTATAPVVATTSSTASQTSPGGITTTTTVTTQTTTNCANTNATVFSNTTIPSNSVLKPAWGFGIILNNALWKTFTKGS